MPGHGTVRLENTTVKWFESEEERMAYLRQTATEEYPVKPVKKRGGRRGNVQSDPGDRKPDKD